MSNFAEQRALLARIVKAKEEIRNHGIIIERQIAISSLPILETTIFSTPASVLEQTVTA